MSSSPSAAVGEPVAPAPGALRPILVLVIGTGVRLFGYSFYLVFILLFLHSAFHLSYVVGGLYVGIVALIGIPAGQLGGGFSDRIGRRRMIVLSLAGEASGLALLAWGFSIHSLVVVVGALFLARSFGASGSPASNAYVAESVDPRLRAQGLSWIRTSFNLGAFGGAALGGLLLTFIPFGELIILAALLVGTAATVNAIWLAPTARDLARKTSGGPLSTAAPNPGLLRWLGQSMHASFRPIWRDRRLLLLVLATILIFVMLYQFAYAIPTFSRTFLGVPFAIVGLAVSLNALIPALTQVPLTTALSGRLHTRIGIWGAVLYAASYLAFGLDAIYRVDLVVALFAMVAVSTLGEDLVFLPIFTLPLNIAPEGARGAYSGALSTANGVANFFAPFLAGVALTYGAHPLVTWGILSVPALPAIVILAYLGSHLPRSQDRI